MKFPEGRKIFFLFVAMTLSFINAKGQLLDTIRASFHARPKIFFQINAYNSFVSKEPANTLGFCGGVEFNKRIRLGLGFYRLTSDIVERKDVKGIFEMDSSLNAQLDMNFVSLTAEYVYYNKEPWQLSVPVNIGAGSSFFWFYKNASGEQARVDEKSIALITISTEAQYKIWKFIGAGAGLGFRVMLKDNSNIDKNFNSVIYNLGLRISLGELFTVLFPKKKS